MPATRRRRIVRRAVMALAVVVLLVVWYVAAFASVSWSVGAGYISGKTDDVMQHTVFAPLRWYAYDDPDKPFANDLRTLRLWCLLQGEADWDSLDE